MIKSAGGGEKRIFRLAESRSPLLWGFLAVLLSAALLLGLYFSGGRDRKARQIPAEVLSKIERERAEAEKAHADFLRTPAGKLWQKHPYWSPEMCQRIIDGRVSPGMSMEQAREAVGRVAEVRPKKGSLSEWVAETREGERVVLKFDGNALVEVKKE